MFTYRDPVTGWHTSYAVGKLERYLPTSGLEPARIPVDKDLARTYVRERNIERHRFHKMTNPHQWTPVIVLLEPGSEINMERGFQKTSIGEQLFPEDIPTGLLVDGHHRYVVAAALGLQEILAWMVPAKIHSRFVIDIDQAQQIAIMAKPGSGVKE